MKNYIIENNIPKILINCINLNKNKITNLIIINENITCVKSLYLISFNLLLGSIKNKIYLIDLDKKMLFQSISS